MSTIKITNPTFQLQLFVFTQMHADSEEIFRTAAEFGVSVVTTADHQVASESLKSVKFDGIIIDADSDGAATVLTAASVSACNRIVPVMCLVSPTGPPPLVSKTDVSLALPKPVLRSAMLASMKLLWTKMVAERQRYFRCPVDFHVLCRSAAGLQLSSRAQNISRGGIAISGAFEASDVVSLQFALPGYHEKLTATGQVVWSRNRLCAIRFLNLPIDTKDLLYDWLTRKCNEFLGIAGQLGDASHVGAHASVSLV